jgi:hypothetical protein
MVVRKEEDVGLILNLKEVSPDYVNYVFLI